MHVARLALIALAFSLSGCAVLPFWPEGQPRIEIARLGSPADGVIPVTTGDYADPYTEVAILNVGPRGDDATADLIADLRLAAREAGADAVVRVDFEVYGAGDDGFTRWSAVGTAVRFR